MHAAEDVRWHRGAQRMLSSSLLTSSLSSQRIWAQTKMCPKTRIKATDTMSSLRLWSWYNIYMYIHMLNMLTKKFARCGGVSGAEGGRPLPPTSACICVFGVLVRTHDAAWMVDGRCVSVVVCVRLLLEKGT